jgi:hypothetical protein
VKQHCQLDYSTHKTRIHDAQPWSEIHQPTVYVLHVYSCCSRATNTTTARSAKGVVWGGLWTTSSTRAHHKPMKANFHLRNRWPQSSKGLTIYRSCAWCLDQWRGVWCSYTYIGDDIVTWSREKMLKPCVPTIFYFNGCIEECDYHTHRDDIWRTYALEKNNKGVYLHIYFTSW